uniref:C2H2-type domain-containing protein n=1 Tax=Caenorhabditis japonica TaxID=281687 RepID=A0A8R1HYY6_CAEJA
MEEFYKELNRPPPPVKLETADVENAVNTSTTDDLLTGLDELGELMETEQKKEEEDMAKLAEYMDQEEKEPTSLIKKRRGKKSTPDGDEKRPNEETKSPLTTFGHSSRPRRSVNYANIERGDEAQAQSLVTEFTSSKKRPKRSRDELDENYEEENGNTSKRKNKKRSSWLSTVGKQSSNNIQLLFDEEQCREAEFALCVPSISDERPSSEYRTIGKALDSHVAIRRASGGFRRFVAWLSDSRIITMMTTVERRHVMNTDSEDKRLVKSVRHVYNSMPQHYRRDWEYAAKMDVFESRHFVQGLSMPVSEIVMKSSVEKPPRNDGVYVQSNCCSMQPQLSEMRQVAEHYLSEHDVVHFFGCDFCHKVFTSRFELTKHDCHDFATMLLEKTMRQESLEMQAAYMFLCCSECGLWLPVKTSISGMKGWNYFATALANHTCLPLVSIIVYFREALPDDGRSIRMSFQFVCSVDVCFPLSCQECKTEDFRTVAEAEDHFLKNHVPLQCSKCPKTFGTEFLFKHHQQIHIAQSAQFANYLTYSATYQPPPNSGRLPHIGFKSEITTIGGFTAVEVAALESADAQADEEFVEPFADTKKAKLLRWRRPDSEKKAKSSDSDSTFSMEKDKLTDSESDSYSSSSETGSSNKRKKAKKDKKQQKKKEFRPDFGYEHINRNELFGREKEEQQAIDGLEKLMHKKLFHTGEHLLNPEDVLKFLEEAVEPKLPVETDSGLAEEIAEATLKIVNLPISNCIDPLKDLMLINKIFYYCKSCQMVFSTDPQEHCSTICETSEDDLMELFHAGCGPYHGIRCVSPACDRKMCSVTSLRNHASTVHNITVALEMMPPSATEILLCHRYDRSMMMLAKHFCEMQTESRTPMARFTDLECYMPFNGLLERKSVLPSLTPAAGSQFARPILPRNNGSLVNGRLAHSGVLVSGSSVSHQLLKSAMNVKPYRIPRTSRWYSCQWCDREFEQLASFVQHLTKTHIHPCQLCGKAFSNAACKRSHTCQRGFDSDGSHRSILTGSCAVCKDRFPIEILFSHYLKRHFSVVEYNQATGEMLPLASDIRLEPLAASRSFDPIAQAPSIGLQEMRTDYRLKLIKMSATPVHGVSLSQLSTRIAPMGSYAMVPPSLKNLDPRLMCYMCEMTHDSVSELLVHLEEAHPERWDQCPFCQTKVDGHHDLQKHLMEAHVIHQDGKTICEFCNESHYRFMCSHLLYRCRKKPCCTICGQKAQDPAVNYSHMRRSHAVTFKRFQCAFCPALFISIGEYYDHTCVGQQARVYSCCCSPDKYFPSVNGFCDHFDSMHVIRNRCKICNIDAPSQENLARHRMSHIIAEAVRNPPRQVFILEKSLFPKKPQVHSSYHRWMEGGVPPPSYIKSTDRSMLNFSTTLMGRESPELTAPINAATGRKLTLFDVLEGGLSTNGNGSQQRVVTLQTANRVDTSPPAKSTQSGDDVIMLSDDDDDLNIVYDSSAQNGAGKNGSPDESLQNGQSGQSQQFSSQVRVEQSEKGYGTSEQPGYVVDDETEVVEPRKTPLGSEPVVKEVVDENGDDELAVVAEVENATGILPSSISFAREKKFKCAQCSNAYYTNGSLQVHIQGHKQDAGAQSCGETYGLPVNCAAFICRNCCIVFENQRKYDEHTKIHGDTIHACNHCSGIAFNLVTIANHMNAHNNRAVTYGCGTCTVKFHSDLALMDHLHITHDVKLFYFCKVCGFGSTDPDRVVNHMSVHSDHHYTMVQRFGACPVQLLNYEPDDEQKFRMKWQSKAIELYEPSDCTHRSMLLSNETVVSCKTCHSKNQILTATRGGYVIFR